MGFKVLNNGKAAPHPLKSLGPRIANGILPPLRFWQVYLEFEVAFGAGIVYGLNRDRRFSV